MNKRFLLIISSTSFLLITLFVGIILLQRKLLAVEPPLREIFSTSLPAQILWQIELEEPINRPPVIVNKRIIISTDDTIYGLDIASGQQIWEHKLESQLSVNLVNIDERVVYGNRIGQIAALNAPTGEMIWHNMVRRANNTITSIVADNKRIYVATQPTEITAIDLQTGETIWHVVGLEQNIPGRGAILFVLGKELYVFTTGLHVLDTETGIIKRVILQNIKPAQLANGKFYSGNWVREAETLELISELISPSYTFPENNCESFRPPYIFSVKYFYAAGLCGGVYGLDIESNQIKWKYREDVKAQSSMGIHRDNLYVLFEDGEIHAIDRRVGQKQGILKTNRHIPGVIQNASFLSRGIVANENVLIATFNDKNVWAFCENPCF